MAKLTITEAARAIGKSPRTVRDMVRNEVIPGTRVGGRWFVNSEDLPGITTETAADRAEAVEQVRHHVNAALDDVSPVPVIKESGKRGFYSVRDVHCHREVLDLLAELRSWAPEDRPAELVEIEATLRRFLQTVTEGFHQFHPDLKVQRLVEARRMLCSALSDLLWIERLHPELPIAPQTQRLEKDILGSLRGLIRTAERRAQKSRSP